MAKSVETTPRTASDASSSLPVRLGQEAVAQARPELEQIVEVGHALARPVVVGIDRERRVEAEIDLQHAVVVDDAARGAPVAQTQELAAIDRIGQRDGARVVLAGGRVVGEPAAAADRADLPERLLRRAAGSAAAVAATSTSEATPATALASLGHLSDIRSVSRLAATDSRRWCPACLFPSPPDRYITAMHENPLLEIALAAARRAGADAADALLVERTSLDVTWRLGALEELERKDAREIGLRVLVGRRVATASTNRADRASIEAMAEDAVAAARLLPEDPWAGLAEASELAAGWSDLDLTDADEPTLEALQRAAAAAEDAARAVPGVTNSEGGSASWSRARVTLAATNGFRGSYLRTRHGLGATVLAGTGTGMQRDYEFRTATHRRATCPRPRPSGGSPASGRCGASARARSPPRGCR